MNIITNHIHRLILASLFLFLVNEAKAFNLNELNNTFPYKFVLIEEQTFTDIRQEASLDAPSLLSVSGALFPLSKRIINEKSEIWYEIYIDEKDSSKIAYIPKYSHVHLARGFLEFPNNFRINLRTSPEILSNNVIGQAQSAGFVFLLDFIPNENTANQYDWFKILISGLDKQSIAYVADLEQGGQFLQMLQQDNFNSKFYNEYQKIKCDSGFAQFAELKADQNLYADNHKNSPVVKTLVKGSQIKVLDSETPTNSELIPIEYLDLYENGFSRHTAYISRLFIKISNKCRPYLAELIELESLEYWGGHAYVSESVYERRANIASGLKRLEKVISKSGEEFSLLETTVFPFEPANATTIQSNFSKEKYPYLDFEEQNKLPLAMGYSSDIFGCPMGMVFNRNFKECRAYFHGLSTSLNPIYGGGICGISTALHRLVFSNGLPVTRWHNHGKYYQSVYGFDDPIYEVSSHQGTEAEVFWSHYFIEDRMHYSDAHGYRFFNDSSSDLRILSDVSIDPISGLTTAQLQLYGSQDKDRTTIKNQIFAIQENHRYKWSSEVLYHSKFELNPTSRLPNITEHILGEQRQIRQQILKSDYHCIEAKNSKGEILTDEMSGLAKIHCFGANYNF